MKRWEKYSAFLESGDWHCHTRYTDGRNTVAEMCRQAGSNGLKLIAFTEHVRKTLTYDFDKLVQDVKRARNNHPGMEILVGCEAKVLDSSGSLDVDEGTLDKCDIVLATFHSFPHTPLNESGTFDRRRLLSPSSHGRLPSREELEKALAGMISNPLVDIWIHPITFFQKCPMCEKDIRQMVELCIKNKVLIEDNMKPRYRSPHFINYCRKAGARIAIGSDAHSVEDLRVLETGKQ
jgi:putative hydrolase